MASNLYIHSVEDLLYVSQEKLNKGYQYIYDYDGNQVSNLPNITASELKGFEVNGKGVYCKPVLKLACFLKNLITEHLYFHNYNFVTHKLMQTQVSLNSCALGGNYKFSNSSGNSYNILIEPKSVYIGETSSNPLQLFKTRVSGYSIYPVVLSQANSRSISVTRSEWAYKELRDYCDVFFDGSISITSKWRDWEQQVQEWNKNPNKDNTPYPQVPNFLDEKVIYNYADLGVYLRDELVYLEQGENCVIATLKLPVWFNTTIGDVNITETDFKLMEYQILDDDYLEQNAECLQNCLTEAPKPNRAPINPGIDLQPVDPGVTPDTPTTPEPWEPGFGPNGYEVVIENKEEAGAIVKCFHLFLKFKIPVDYRYIYQYLIPEKD